MQRVDYELLTEQLFSLGEDAPHFMTLLSNSAALFYEMLPEINWAGFYLTGPFLIGSPDAEKELWLGPFGGKPACTRIPYGQGVCGTAWATQKTQLVPDVHAFPGHIACDSASNSEIVIPLRLHETIVGVLDIDSPLLNRFEESDRLGLEKCARLLEDLMESLTSKGETL